MGKIFHVIEKSAVSVPLPYANKKEKNKVIVEGGV